VPVAGGVSPRKLANGQSPIQYPDLLSASTTLVQSGSGYMRLVNALQTLDQAENILAVVQSITSQAAAIATLQSQVATLQSQVTSINGQIGIINTRLDQLSNSIVNLTSQLGGWTFGPVGATVPSIAAGNVPATNAGTQYLLPLYSS
jgi:septal ring factor EnvC (AmiA/AmiB activator)